MRGPAIHREACLLLGLLTCWCTQAQPRLSAVRVNDTAVALSWDDPAGEFHLESVTGLNGGIRWEPVAQSPVIQGTTRNLSVDLTDQARFFRLSGAGTVLTTIVETSPREKESGVAVTRETVLRFSSSLAPNAGMSASNLFAEFSGRKILGQVELSSDRRSATLFYLENLPGGSRIKVSLFGEGV